MTNYHLFDTRTLKEFGAAKGLDYTDNRETLIRQLKRLKK